MPDLTWDSTAQRFRGAGGRFVREDAVRGAIEDVIGQASDRLAGLTDRLKSGAITLPDWQSGMRAELKNLHSATATIAHGGRLQMAPADWGWVSGRLRNEYNFLAGFALDNAQGKPISTGRARLYAESARQTFEEMKRRDARLRGSVEEKWVRRASESCAGCIEQSGRGWLPAGQLPRLSSQQCKTRCKCVIQTRPVAQEAA